jgi:membrane protein insertase Oxa1/YidC/SpoIIIJ
MCFWLVFCEGPMSINEFEVKTKLSVIDSEIKSLKERLDKLEKLMLEIYALYKNQKKE